jgi:hypothetical protein
MSSARPPPPPWTTSPSQATQSRPSSSSSVESQDSIPAHPPWRRETNHLTPDHRPRPVSPLRNQSHPYGVPPAHEKQWGGEDPRSSSMQSLLPIESAGASRRTLLLIYIHGFMGNETSFKSFPAHVHNVLTVTLSESHVVHSKIYPRYRSRKPIEHARDDFSNWFVRARSLRGRLADVQQGSLHMNLLTRMLSFLVTAWVEYSLRKSQYYNRTLRKAQMHVCIGY